MLTGSKGMPIAAAPSQFTARPYRERPAVDENLDGSCAAILVSPQDYLDYCRRGDC